MGFFSDTEIDFEDDQGGDTPPQSPRLAATHAQTIAEKVASTGSDLSENIARNYAALCCEEFGLADLDKEDVLRVSQMNPHLIAIRQYTRVVALTHNINQLLTESFLDSAEFKDHVTRRIQATFLDATIPTYVRGSTARLIQHMQDNPSSWRIPPVVHAHFVNSKAFRKAVAAVASNFRGDMRRKIKKSMVDKLDIGALANKLCVKGYQPTIEHWRRFALLRCYMADWEKLPCHPGKGRGISFWAYIDTKLDKVRTQCAKPTKEATEIAIKLRLKANLKNDQQQFTGPASGRTKLPKNIQIPDWQRDHGKAVSDMSGYVVEVSPEDEDEEDDTADGSGPQTSPRVQSEASGDRERSNNTGDTVGPGGVRETQQTGAAVVGVEHQASDGRTGRVLVPETQESESLGGTPQGWASGTLVNRHPRTTHAFPSPISRPGSSSTSQLRPS
ncbi:unnamed protein product [Rhizoctonia solani]|uniref:Uncharacterized protein n=1 Tax=Rhizoctonia solani TaxID=456999 RepID=A0A8H2X770_9AGAM|nr:unnamed protein product [Rhizoctonia solani]